MLNKLRNKKTAKKVWIFLAIIIMPAFVLWGSGSLMRSKDEPENVGRIFGKNISALEYADALRAVRNAAIMRFGEDFSEAQKYLNLESQALDRIILLYEAKKKKISASDKEVIGLIESYPFFQRNGKFDHKIYSEVLRYVFHTQPRVFEEQGRQNLILSKLLRTVTSGITVDEKEIKEEYKKANQEISIYYIASAPSSFIEAISYTEQDIKDYFARNQLDFKQPVSFNLEYIASLSEDKIKDALSRLNNNAGLKETAGLIGANVKETGLFSQADSIPGIGWSPEILNLVSKLKPGQFTQPVYLDKYYYILRLKERKEAYIPDFEKIKDRAKDLLIKERSSELAKEKITQALKKLKDSYNINPGQADFAKTARTYGLKSDSTALFKYGSYIEGIGASDSFWIKAQELKEGEFSDIISMPSGFYIIKLKSKAPVDEKKFAGEKEEFRQRLLSQKQQEYFAAFTQDLRKRAQ